MNNNVHDHDPRGATTFATTITPTATSAVTTPDVAMLTAESVLAHHLRLAVHALPFLHSASGAGMAEVVKMTTRRQS
jgi:hypothetical protein